MTIQKQNLNHFQARLRPGNKDKNSVFHNNKPEPKIMVQKQLLNVNCQVKRPEKLFEFIMNLIEAFIVLIFFQAKFIASIQK